MTFSDYEDRVQSVLYRPANGANRSKLLIGTPDKDGNMYYYPLLAGVQADAFWNNIRMTIRANVSALIELHEKEAGYAG